MKTRLGKMLTDLRKMLEQADTFSNSDNETTADKYADVYGSLEAAITEIEAAIERLAE